MMNFFDRNGPRQQRPQVAPSTTKQSNGQGQSLAVQTQSNNVLPVPQKGQGKRVLAHVVSRTAATSDGDSGGKPKHRNTRHLQENSTLFVPSYSNEVRAAAARSGPRDASKLHKSKASDIEAPICNLQDPSAGSSYIPTVAEHLRLKREVESLRKSNSESKKTIKNQAKTIEDLRLQDIVSREKLEESEAQLQKLRGKSKKSEEFVTAVESNAQCQICMELLLKPYALSPCGHVLCVTCLQEWFRKAPQSDNDMDDPDDPDYLLCRRKICPCCRTDVRHRPIPIFVIKSMTTALAKIKDTSRSVESSNDIPNEVDPWEGLFLLSEGSDEDDSGYEEEEEEADEEDEDEDEDEDEYEGEIDDDDDEHSDWYGNVFSYGTDSDEDQFEGEYVDPQWEPPTISDIEDDVYEPLGPHVLGILSRGVSRQMLEAYDVEYSHDYGLVIPDGVYNIFVGWNIQLSADDENGEAYMQYLREDMDNRPERWRLFDRQDGTFDAHLLVRDCDVHDYSDTDSCCYMDMVVEDRD